MTADTYSSALGLILQGTGNNNNTWGTTFNNSGVTPIDRAIAGVNTITATSGTVELSATVPPAGLRADIDFVQRLTGALVGHVTVQVPNVSKVWWFQNDTTNAFNVYVKTPSGTAIQIPQGTGRLVIGYGSNVLVRGDKDEVGSIRISGKAAIGAGELACNGASFLKADFPDLYAAISVTWGSTDSLHFSVPDFTTNNRFLRAAGGSVLVGTYQSNQNAAHTHSVTGAPAVGTLTTDSQGSHTHTATVTDPGHTHSYQAGQSASVFAGGGFAALGANIGAATGSSTTGISVANATAGTHTHGVTGALTAGTLATASQGGSEARPESAAVLFGIRY